MMTRFLTLLVLTSLPFGVAAHEYKVGDLIIDHPVAAETAQSVTATAGAAYMVITNNGDTDDTLLAVTADFPQVTLHETVIQNEIASMTRMENIVIPAGETVSLEPGGLHIMFMGLNGDPFTDGERIPATLVFEDAGAVDVVFNVEALDHNHNH